MNAAAYQRVLLSAHGVRALAQNIARGGELDAAIEACGRAGSVGHIVDPTLYRDRHAALAQDEETLRAVRELAQLGQDLTGKGEATGSDRVGLEAPGDGRSAHPAAPLPVETTFGEAS